jgi:hypothetical protein
MGLKARATRVKEEAQVMRLAEHLRREASSETVLESLELLCSILNEPKKKDSLAVMFLRAGGLPTLIHHLGGTTPSTCNSSPDSIQFAVTEKASEAVTLLIRSGRDIVMPTMEVVTGIMAPLMDILRAGSLQNRCLAAEVLLLLAMGQVEEGSDMANAGVMGLLLSLYVEIQ